MYSKSVQGTYLIKTFFFGGGGRGEVNCGSSMCKEVNTSDSIQMPQICVLPPASGSFQFCYVFLVLFVSS